MFPTFFLSPPAGAALPPEAVRVLLHFDGAPDDTTTIDSSTYGRTITMGVSKLAATGVFGSGTYWIPTGLFAAVVIAEYDDEAFRIDNSDWCMECWINHGSGDFGGGNLFSVGYPSLTDRLDVVLLSGTTLTVRSYIAGVLEWTITGDFVADTWQHVALVRHNGDIKLYIQGVLKATQAAAVLFSGASPQFGISLNLGGQYEYWNGAIDEVRFVNGYPVYEDEFTPPTENFPDP